MISESDDYHNDGEYDDDKSGRGVVVNFIIVMIYDIYTQIHDITTYSDLIIFLKLELRKFDISDKIFIICIKILWL